MLQILAAALHLASKDLRQWLRDPVAIVAGLAAPMAMLIIGAVVFGISGDSWPTGISIEGKGPYSQQLHQLVGKVSSNITPYFEVVTTDSREAQELARQGRLFMSVRVPEDFDAQLASGKPGVIETYQYNVNTDMSKNTRLRMDSLLLAFREKVLPEQTPVLLERKIRRPEDVWRRTFIAGGVVTFALIVCGMLYTSISTANEWQKATSKELLLSPVSHLAVVFGKLMAGMVQTLLTAAVIFLLGFAFLDLKLGSNWPSIMGLGVLTALAFCSLGGLLGVLLKNIRAVLPLAIVTSVGTFFATGGFTSVATLPAGARAVAPFIPTTYAYETIQALLFELPAVMLLGAVLLFTAITFIAAWLMLMRLRGEGSPRPLRKMRT